MSPTLSVGPRLRRLHRAAHRLGFSTTRDRTVQSSYKVFFTLTAVLLLVVAGVTAPCANATLLVSSNATDQVLRYDQTTGAFAGIFASGGGLDGPQGLVFGPDGNLYVVSEFTAEVKRYNGATGAFIDTFASGGLDRPTGLVFGPDGNLYVASNTDNSVKRYNGITGALIDTFIS